MTTLSIDPTLYDIPPFREDHGGEFSKEQYITDLAIGHNGRVLTPAASGADEVAIEFGFDSEANARLFRDTLNRCFVPCTDGPDEI